MKEIKAKITKKMKYWITNYLTLNSKLEITLDNMQLAKMEKDDSLLKELKDQHQELLLRKEQVCRMFKNCDDIYDMKTLEFILDVNSLDDIDKKLKPLVNNIYNKLQSKVDEIDRLIEAAKARGDKQTLNILLTSEKLLKENCYSCFGVVIKPSLKNNKRR